MKHTIILVLLGGAAVLFAVDAISSKSLVSTALTLLAAALFVERL